MSSNAPNDGVHLMAIKFVENLILIYTSSDTSSNAQTPSPVLLPPTHMLLSSNALYVEADKLLNSLCKQVQPPQGLDLPGPVCIVLIGSTAGIAQQRPQFMDTVVPMLLDLAHHVPTSAESATVASVVRALRDSFLKFLKSGMAEAVERKDALVEALHALGAEDAVRDALQRLDRQAARAAKESAKQDAKRVRDQAAAAPSTSDADPAAKRTKLDPPNGAAPPGGGAAAEAGKREQHLQQVLLVLREFLATKQMALVNQLVANLQPEVLADVVISNLCNLPETLEEAARLDALHAQQFPSQPGPPPGAGAAPPPGPPPGAPFPGSAPPPAAPAAPPPGIPPLHAPMHAPPPPPAMRAPPAGAAPASAIHGVDVKPDIKPDIKGDVKHDITAEVAVKTEEGEGSAAAPAPMPLGAPPPLPSTPLTALAAPKLSLAEVREMRQLALCRVLNPGTGSSSAPGAAAQALQHALVARLAARPAAAAPGPAGGAAFTDELVNHTVERLAAGAAADAAALDLALHWLFQLYLQELAARPRAAGQEREVAEDGPYDRAALALTKAIISRVPHKERALCKVAAALPRICGSVFAALQALCFGACIDASTLGLQTMWDLIMQRPPLRRRCLQVVLRCAVRPEEQMRSKAIRLVANRLLPFAPIAADIVAFSRECLDAAVTPQAPSPPAAAPPPPAAAQPGADSDLGAAPMEEDGAGAGEEKEKEEDRSRLVPLFFALCTKEHALLESLFAAYGRIPGPEGATHALFHQHLGGLVKALGVGSAHLLGVLRAPPPGSMKIVHMAIAAAAELDPVPQPQLVETVKQLYQVEGDVKLLVPVLGGLPKEEVRDLLPALVGLPENVQQVLHTVLAHDRLTAPELLILLHNIQPSKQGTPLRKVIEAINMCFENRAVFTPPVLAQALNHLVEQDPLPLLLMRTVMHTAVSATSLLPRILEILSKLVNKQVWKHGKLWEGFVKCAQISAPDSYPVLLQLPPTHLTDAFRLVPALQKALAKYCAAPEVQGHLPHATLLAVGLIHPDPDPNAAPPAAAGDGEGGAADEPATGEESDRRVLDGGIDDPAEPAAEAGVDGTVGEGQENGDVSNGEGGDSVKAVGEGGEAGLQSGDITGVDSESMQVES